MAGVDFDADEPPEEFADEIIPAMMGAVAECEVSLGDLSGDGGDDDADKPSDDGDASSEGDGTYGSDPELDERLDACGYGDWRWEEHTSELQSLMRTSYDVFSLKK